MAKTTRNLALLAAAAAIVACNAAASKTGGSSISAIDVSKMDGAQAFAVVQRVLQHPRCQNCHIAGDAPLQFDDGRVHGQNVLRGPLGRGAAGLSCATCHAIQNPPPSYGEHMPPGAPDWHLPPPEHKMVFQDLTATQLSRQLKDRTETGGRDLAALLQHVTEDKLVLWGWDPGVGRAPVDVPHDVFVAAFKRWVDAGAPTPP